MSTFDYWLRISCAAAFLMLGIVPVAQAQGVDPSNNPDIIVRRDGNITNHTHNDDSRPTHDLSCLSIREIRASYSPPDLYLSASRCLEADRYEEAADAVLVAIAFGHFDTQRVTDRSAHQVIGSMGFAFASQHSEAKIMRLQNTMKARLDDKAKICADVAPLGPPSYQPTYMAAHSIQVFRGTQPAELIDATVDANALWSNTQASFMKCG